MDCAMTTDAIGIGKVGWCAMSPAAYTPGRLVRPNSSMRTHPEGLSSIPTAARRVPTGAASRHEQDRYLLVPRPACAARSAVGTTIGDSQRDAHSTVVRHHGDNGLRTHLPATVPGLG